MYEMATGRLPFRGEGVAALRQEILTHLPPALQLPTNDVPPALERICFRCLAKKAADRYSTARELARDLRELLDTVA